MRTGIREAHESLEKWYSDGCVGYVVFFHPPGKNPGENSKVVDCYAEEVIKIRELPDGVQVLVNEVFKRLEFDKAEFICDGDGRPDRIKVTRRIR